MEQHAVPAGENEVLTGVGGGSIVSRNPLLESVLRFVHFLFNNLEEYFTVVHQSLGRPHSLGQVPVSPSTTLV